MKRVISVVLIFVLIMSLSVGAFADDGSDEKEVELVLTQIFNDSFDSPSEWISDDLSKALLGVCLYADGMLGDDEISEMFDVTDLYSGGYIARTGAGSRSMHLMLILYGGGNALLVDFSPALGYAVYSVVEGVTKAAVETVLEDYTYWELESDSLDLVIDMILDALNSD